MRRAESPEPASARFSTAAEYVAAGVRDDILSRRLKPGQSLRLTKLASQYGTSHIPVREALRILAAEGLVILRPHHSAVVTGEMSLVEYDDLFNVRLLVETQALRLAQGRFFRDKHEEVLRIIDSMEDALQRGDVAAGLAHHKHAHLTIYALAGSPALLQVIDNLWDQCDRNVHTSMAASADAGLAAAEHRELADLLARNELDASLAALQSHLEMTRLAFRHRELAERTGADDGDAASPSIGYRSERATG